MLLLNMTAQNNGQNFGTNDFGSVAMDRLFRHSDEEDNGKVKKKGGGTETYQNISLIFYSRIVNAQSRINAPLCSPH